MRSLSLFLTLATTPTTLPAQEPGLGAMEWLVGCWERTAANRRAVEKWFASRDGAMQGTSQVIGAGEARETEQLRIFESSGALV